MLSDPAPDAPPPAAADTPPGGGIARAAGGPDPPIDCPVASREQTRWTDEAQVALDFGFAREVVSELRARILSPALEWILYKKRILISEQGLEKLRSALGAPEGKKEGGAAPAFGDGENGQDGAARDEPVALTVTMVPRNRHILLAKKEDGTEVRLRVRDNVNFLIGMQCRGRHAHEDVYDLEGRAPRFRGRW
jgi:hypothetical protein